MLVVTDLMSLEVRWMQMLQVTHSDERVSGTVAAYLASAFRVSKILAVEQRL
jgi:hypothetical protein